MQGDRQVESVQKAIAVLDVLAAAGEELGTNEIARRTDINASTVSRALRASGAKSPARSAVSGSASIASRASTVGLSRR